MGWSCDITPAADPRSLKTWLHLAAALNLATGRALGGYCRVAAPTSVGYITNEDGARRIADRLAMLMRGMEISRIPDTLHVAVHRGVWLDDPDWQARVIATVRDRRIRALLPDPLRSLSGCVDQGPRELQPLAMWLRRLQDETGCAVWLNHHNTKPLAGQKDDRRRPHRASGGGLFSIADAPIMLERIGDTNRALVTPSSWKFAEDPAALEIELCVNGDAAQLHVRPAETAIAADAALRDRVLAFLAENPGQSSNRVARGIKANKAAVLAALNGLSAGNRVDCVKAERGNQWFIRRSENAPVPPVPSGSGTGPCSGSSGSPYGGGNRGTGQPLPGSKTGEEQPA